MKKEYYVKHSYTLIDPPHPAEIQTRKTVTAKSQTSKTIIWGPFPYHALAEHKALGIAVDECIVGANHDGTFHGDVTVEILDGEETLNVFDLSD